MTFSCRSKGFVSCSLEVALRGMYIFLFIFLLSVHVLGIVGKGLLLVWMGVSKCVFMFWVRGSVAVRVLVITRRVNKMSSRVVCCFFSVIMCNVCSVLHYNKFFVKNYVW